MNKIKLFAIFALGVTFGEFLSSFRLRTTPTTLKHFTKEWLSFQVKGFGESYRAGKLVWESPKQSRAQFKTIIFPNRKS
jgi:hypothetical protein